jgi:hypothetical protein
VSAFEDLVLCGPGFDRVLADSKDKVTPADCEQVRIIEGFRKEVSRQQERFFASLPPIFLEGLPPIGKEGTSAALPRSTSREWAQSRQGVRPALYAWDHQGRKFPQIIECLGQGVDRTLEASGR